MDYFTFKNKKILVTGGAGLLGSSLTEKFLSYESDLTSTYFNRKPIESSKANYIRYDFTNFQDCLDATEGQDLS